MEAANILRKARALIDTPEKWTKGCSARDSHGRHADLHGISAVCFCSFGAIRSAGSYSDECDAAERFLVKASGTNQKRIAHWNDAPERTHAEVMAAFDKAIKLAEASK